MKKYISLILGVVFCFIFSVTALAETVIIAPEDVSNPDIKTSVLTTDNGLWLWIGIAVIAVIIVVLIIAKKRKKR